MTHLLVFAAGAIFGAFGAVGIECWRHARKAEPPVPVCVDPHLVLVDPHQLSITDLAAWAESRGPRGAA